MSWSDERVELLKKLWGEGQSASQIAKELGGVTRNAVIGKVHRLGLSNRNGSGGAAAATAPAESAPKPKPSAPKPEAKAKPAPKPAPKPEPKPTVEEAPEAAPAAPVSRVRQIIPAGQPLPPQPSTNEIDPAALAKVSEVEKKAKRLSLMELTERTCKWPVGDPATDDFWFCGLSVQSGKPYCEAHVGVAFQPMSSRRDRKR
ncbi:GcrA cell cycle regulator [Roseovarius gahaiensis]|uniref:GcrA cell cycle regulator n=1 Tax=Roseovarius gahaiensis TaxID=2716691 RepID=A0A967BEN6_9RHOB|nr:GcrA family cell cycle regulator [Roseovarius gahaiensis]NHQ75145.1 GcrA cell cycle regulator [Roseovarius gahaiensis]